MNVRGFCSTQHEPGEERDCVGALSTDLRDLIDGKEGDSQLFSAD
jgi:hypothetical protein